jgi:hypothetical protein
MSAGATKIFGVIGFTLAIRHPAGVWFYHGIGVAGATDAAR